MVFIGTFSIFYMQDAQLGNVRILVCFGPYRNLNYLVSFGVLLSLVLILLAHLFLDLAAAILGPRHESLCKAAK